MKAIILAVIFLIVGAIMGSSVNSSLNGWFTTLNKPFLNPPNFIFAPIWTILYISLAIFYWLLDREQYSPKINEIKRLFIWQLVLNFLWTPIFFGMQNILAGLIILIIIDFLVLRIIRLTLKINKLCVLIILPYFCWLLFASYLNASLFILN
ncbi:MAG: tryptophan-rich sensory protein [Elusimicrobiaceae bacterium]|nr:tryptophan-rich sensory protein [Elusimicrobiaceae bacterium]